MSKKIRVLVVDDIPESRDSVSRLLKFETDIEVVGTANGGRDAVQQTLLLRPDIVLMDINMPDMDGITAAGLIAQQAPNSAVIMMSVQNEADYLRRSMQAGAREFLVKPFSLDDLIRSIREVNENRRVVVAQAPGQSSAKADNWKQTTERGSVIVGFNPKGGTGCSTLLANLAVATKMATKKQVALVDGDLQFGDLGAILNLPPSKTIVDLAINLRQMDDDLLADVMMAHSSGVKLLLAPPSPQQAEKVTPDSIRPILDKVANQFDYVFVDTGTSFDETVLAMLDVSDHILLIINNELTSVKAARNFLEISELLGYTRSKKIHIVLNRATAPSAVTAAAISENLHRPVEAQVVDDAKTVIASINDGVPFVLSAPDSKVARDIQTIVHILDPSRQVEAAEAAKVETKRPGLAGLFAIGRTR